MVETTICIDSDPGKVKNTKIQTTFMSNFFLRIFEYSNIFAHICKAALAT